MSFLCCCCKPTDRSPPGSPNCLRPDVAQVGQLDDSALITRIRSLCPEKFREIAGQLLTEELGIEAALLSGKAYKIMYTEHAVKRRSFTIQPHYAFNQPKPRINQGLLLHLKEISAFLLLEKSLKTKLIFRQTGSTSREKRLKADINNSRRQLSLDSGFYSPHDCATVLKGFLADMPEPLMTDVFYPAYDALAGILTDRKFTGSLASISSLPEMKKAVISLGLLIQMLPDENRKVLQTVITILKGVADYSKTNMMPAKDLSIIMAPHLFCPRELPPEAFFHVSKKMAVIVKFMMNNAVDLFKPPPELCDKIRKLVESAS